MEEKKVIKVSLGTVICIVIIVLLVIALGGMWYYYNYIKDSAQTSIQTDTQTNVIEETKTENLYNYIGKWYISTDNYEGSQYERELTISKIENNKLTFSLFVFRTEVDENIVGTIEDNVVTFSDVIKGTMTFENNTITLKITESANNNYIKGTLVFDKKIESQVAINNDKYETITDELDGIDFLYITEVNKENNKYTLKGTIYSQYIIPFEEVERANNNGYYSLNNEKYRVEFVDKEYNLYDSNENLLYKIKVLNKDEYFIESQTQISNVWNKTDKYMQITLDSSTKCIGEWYEDQRIIEEKTVEDLFKNYSKREPENSTNPSSDCTYAFKFENGKCVEVINIMTSI